MLSIPQGTVHTVFRAQELLVVHSLRQREMKHYKTASSLSPVTLLLIYGGTASALQRVTVLYLTDNTVWKS